MKKCKLSRCDEPYVGYGKQYCTFHASEHKRKGAEAKIRNLTKPKCVNFDMCKGNLGYNQDIYCMSCAREAEKRLNGPRIVTMRDDALEYLSHANTVEELKTWISRFVVFKGDK